MQRALILASGSPYRSRLLSSLGFSFESISPAIDETRHDDEAAASLVRRLAEAKARAVLRDRKSSALIIGSDQVGELNGRILGKPCGRDAAIRQLHLSSGQKVRFLTGLCVLDADTGRVEVDVILYAVNFRELTSEEISSYVDSEKPFDCAGSFRVEGPGIALFSKLEGDDPTALQGLPLIRLTEMLRKFQVNPLLRAR